MVRRDLEGAALGLAPSQPIANNVSTNQTFVVSTLADSGAGSLRQVMLAPGEVVPVIDPLAGGQPFHAVLRTLILLSTGVEPKPESFAHGKAGV